MGARYGVEYVAGMYDTPRIRYQHMFLEVGHWVSIISGLLALPLCTPGVNLLNKSRLLAWKWLQPARDNYFSEKRCSFHS